MKKLGLFLSSNLGRYARAAAGISLVWVTVLYRESLGAWSWLGYSVAGVLFIGALFDLCVISYFVNKDAQGSKPKRAKKLRSTSLTTALIIAIAGLIASVGLAYHLNKDGVVIITKPIDELTIAMPPAETKDTAVTDNAKTQNEMLVYLIEEEKLAHDVYTKMYDKYGARVFGKILDSEQTHQDRVLMLLTARGIADPRTGVLGKFNNPDLQALYDKLMVLGEKNAEEAYKVGVLVEETDIADITKQLATATDSDTVVTLEALRNGSENHLRAFNRQLGEY